MTGEISHQELCLKISIVVIYSYHYLVESINKVCCHDDYDDEEYGDEDESIREVTSKSLKKGTWLLKSGFVHDPQDNVDENNQYCILRGKDMFTIQ